MSGERFFELPDLGEGLQEAEIVAWHVSVGDHVVADQPLLSVETDKAVVEVPSPRSGHVAALHGKPGDIVAVGSLLVEFAEAATDAGAIVGELDRQTDSLSVQRTEPAPRKVEAKIGAAPAARKLASELRVDLSGLTGTGPDGTIQTSDVRAAALAPTSTTEHLRGVRRTMLRRMTSAGREVVASTITDEADIESWAPGTDVTIRLLRAVALGCSASPSLNVWFDAESEARTLHNHVDVAVAVETSDGLFAPVLRDVLNRDEASLREGLEEIKRQAVARSISRATMKGATITLSNFGMFGGRFADLVVTPPQVAILGAGRITPRVVSKDGLPVVHKLLPLSLSFDHRVVTGIESLRFLTATIAELEKPNITD